MTGIKISVTLERTIYLDIPENTPDEELPKLVGQQVILPHDALFKAAEILKRANIRVDGLDIGDWTLVKTDYSAI